MPKFSDLRRVKKFDEIKKINNSIQYSEELLTLARNKVKLGVSELEVEFYIREQALKLGCADLAFKPIVAFGKHSSVPHHQSTTKRLKLGKIILIDLGVKHDGYCSDITRTFFAGQPFDEQVKIYNFVSDALSKGLSTVKKSASAINVYNNVKNYFENCGFCNNFVHSAGHGIGLEVHEAPSLSSNSKHKLYENEALAIEPGLYDSSWGGIRLENMVVVKNGGCKVLNKLPLGLDFAIIKDV